MFICIHIHHHICYYHQALRDGDTGIDIGMINTLLKSIAEGFDDNAHADDNKDVSGTLFRQHVMTHFNPPWSESALSSSASRNVHRMIPSVENDIEVSISTYFHVFLYLYIHIFTCV
jgi:hypothetical protein